MTADRRRHVHVLAMASTLLMLVSSCADPRLSELEAYAASVGARPAAQLDPIPEVPPLDTFVYAEGDRRDPFAMDRSTAGGAQQGVSELAPDPRRRKEPLEAYSLDSLSMVGTLEQYQTRWALITTPDGILHRVRVGNYIGRNNGEIVQIGPKAVEVSELVEDEPGQWQQRQASIALKE